MTIGLQTPGQPTDVTPDAQPVTPYTSVQGPAPDGPVVATDVLQAIQVALNVQTQLDQLSRAIPTGTTSQMIALTGRQTGDTYEVISRGLYRFVSGATADFGAPWSYTSTGSSGVWISEILTMVTSTTGGIARVGPVLGIDSATPSGKIPLTIQQNYIRLYGVIGGASRLDTQVTANNVAFLTDYIVTIADVVEGDTFIGQVDRILVTYGGSAGDGRIYAHLVCDYDGSPETVNLGTYDIASTLRTGGVVPLSMSIAGIATKSGNAQIKIYVIAPTDATVTLWGIDGSGLSIGRFWTYRP